LLHILCYWWRIIVKSVNTYTSMMGISTEDKHLIKSLPENKKYRVKRLLKLFPNKNWSLDGLKALIIDNTGTVQTVRGHPLPNMSNNSTCVVNLLDQRFQSTKTPVFARKHSSNRFAPYFLFSGKKTDQVLIFSANSHHWRIGINWRHN